MRVFETTGDPCSADGAAGTAVSPPVPDASFRVTNVSMRSCIAELRGSDNFLMPRGGTTGAWTLTGTADLADIMGEIPVAGTPRAQRETLPLDPDVAVFP